MESSEDKISLYTEKINILSKEQKKLKIKFDLYQIQILNYKKLINNEKILKLI